jgi:thymidylate synthase
MNIGQGLYNLRKDLYENGYIIKTDRWQGKENPPEFIEILHASMNAQMAQTREEAIELLKPMLPWADEHFQERVSGLPLNPPPSHKNWLKGNEEYLADDIKFSHSYPERFWSKTLHNGIRYDIGDLNDLIDLMKNDNYTRQAYLPIFFPEDLGAAKIGERIPCTLGYHFILRNGELHLFYPMRSCDVLRHLHNDLYMANLLAIYVNEKAGLNARIGKIQFNATSLHCFKNDMYPLKKSLGI